MHERDLFCNIILQSIIRRCSSSIIKGNIWLRLMQILLCPEIQPSKRKEKTKGRGRGALSKVGGEGLSALGLSEFTLPLGWLLLQLLQSYSRSAFSECWSRGTTCGVPELRNFSFPSNTSTPALRTWEACEMDCRLLCTGV